jgi:hypothetical protein
VVTTIERKGYAGSHTRCAKCGAHHHPSALCRTCYNCRRPGHLLKKCRAVVNQAAPVNVVNPGRNQRACFECGSDEHFQNTCPRLNRAPGQARNNQNLVLENVGNQAQGNAGKQACGRAFVMGANEAREDPNVVTGTFLLNNYFASILFDTGADKSFASTKFAPLPGIAPSCLDVIYSVEMANGTIVKTKDVIRDCTVYLSDHPFKIDLIPFELGSFDVAIRMDWLSKHKVEIVCPEKYVRIPLLNDEILVIRGERPRRDLKIITCMKARRCPRKKCYAF